MPDSEGSDDEYRDAEDRELNTIDMWGSVPVALRNAVRDWLLRMEVLGGTTRPRRPERRPFEWKTAPFEMLRRTAALFVHEDRPAAVHRVHVFLGNRTRPFDDLLGDWQETFAEQMTRIVAESVRTDARWAYVYVEWIGLPTEPGDAAAELWTAREDASPFSLSRDTLAELLCIEVRTRRVMRWDRAAAGRSRPPPARAASDNRPLKRTAELTNAWIEPDEIQYLRFPRFHDAYHSDNPFYREARVYVDNNNRILCEETAARLFDATNYVTRPRAASPTPRRR